MKKIYLLLILTFALKNVFSQNIAGIINNYAQVTSITQNVVGVSTTNGFAVGDKVMLIKVKGAQINQTNTAAYGDTTTLGEAGKYLFSFIIAIDPFPNNTVTLSPFCDVFDDTAYMQIVTVPIYPNPVINAPLTCQPWDGLTGGILIFETPNTLTFNADINTQFKGYRGGDVWGTVFSCGNLNYFSAMAFFGPEGKKGEGAADWILGQECGKGKLANGGGGAYSGNTGAGGGANGGKGGDGGFEFNGCGANPLIYSIGGVGINHFPNKLFMGGGGGGPQTDNGQQVYNGGNGGAIVFIKANDIVGNGFSIINSGESPPQINDEGAPGGGAGGSVYLSVPTYSGNLSIDVKGGNGSSNFNVLFAGNCHGPAGGGGGGLVWFSTPATPLGVAVNTAGGNAGLVLNPVSPCFNTPYNAQNGNAGAVKYNFVPTPLVVPPTISIGNDTVICPNANLVLDAGAGFVTYLWDDNTTAQTRTVNTPGTFFVTVTTPDNCTASDTIIVSIDTSVVADFTATLHLGCENDTVFLVNNSQGGATYNWLFGDGGYSSFQHPVPYVYIGQDTNTIRLIVTNGGCADTMSILIDNRHPLFSTFDILNSTPGTGALDSICLGFEFWTSLTPLAPAGANWIHDWNWGDGTPITHNDTARHFYTTPGIYTLWHIVTDTLGCKDSTSMLLFVDGIPIIDYTVTDSVICVGEKITFADYLTANIIDFNWDFADGSVLANVHNPTHAWSDAGTYNVSLNAFSTFCPDKSFSKLITVNSFPQLSLGPDTSMCPGVTGSVFLADINNPTATYTWSTGETGNGITVTQPGYYWVRASNGECTTTDSIWIRRDCYINVPNAFTPDGDGLNDYFLPREILSSGIKTFKMDIYNRWGENIFTTTSIEGRGWDGKYNGVPQLMGTYVYVMDVEFVNNIRKTFKGNVTLIR